MGESPESMSRVELLSGGRRDLIHSLVLAFFPPCNVYVYCLLLYVIKDDRVRESHGVAYCYVGVSPSQKALLLNFMCMTLTLPLP